jgi:hypothetical protein
VGAAILSRWLRPHPFQTRTSIRYTYLLLLIGLLLAAPPSADAQEDDGSVIYMTQHKVHPAKMDSLMTLIQEFSIPWQNFIAENVEGYWRTFSQHDTGNEYNYMIVTTYPSRDTVDSMPEDSEFAPQFMENMEMTEEEARAAWAVQFEGYTWANEDIRHIDQIWRPISRPMNNMDEEMMGEEME